MLHRTLAVAGAAEPELVWDRYAVVDCWPTWAPLIGSVKASGPSLEPGLTGVVRGPLGMPVSFVVISVHPARRCWSWSVHAGPVTAHLDHEVLGRPGGGTVATLSMRGPALPVLAYLPAATWALGRLTRP